MTAFYLILALFLALSLNQPAPIPRALGTLVAALALALIAWSIVLANLDGSFAAMPGSLKPLLLNAQAVVAALAALFLLWASWAQLRRRVEGGLPLANTAAGFGWLSRLAHWAMGVLMLVLIPIGLFISVLPPGHPEREAFIATHQSLGIAVLGLVALRALWLRRSPAPAAQPAPSWQLRAARLGHLALYGLMIGFPLTGLLLNAARGDTMDVFGWTMPPVMAPQAGLAAVAGALHNLVLPALFHATILLHLAGALKGRAVLRRMLR